MIVDDEKMMIYVYGGRVITADPLQITFSGLYSWNIKLDVWRLIRDDSTQLPNSINLKSRIGHSMLFNSKSRELYILAGQRHQEHLSDFYIYQLDTDSVIEVARDYSKVGGPEAGFTQRATIDVESSEIYLFSGLIRDKKSPTAETVKNAFWNYSMRTGKWSKIYQNESTSPEYWSKMSEVEPLPRYAHQLVYDTRLRMHFMFGGNPGEPGNSIVRLDDFWKLKLVRPTSQDVLRKCKFQIRRLQYDEMCRFDKRAALAYLQTQVSLVVDHLDAVESVNFRKLATNLFSWSKQSGDSDGIFSVNSDVYTGRCELYELISDFFPTSMREPKSNIVDLLQ